MKLITVEKTDEGEVPGHKTRWWHDFRLLDDNGEPMHWVKSVKLHVEANHAVIMTIERYVMDTDEIDVDLFADAVQIEEVEVQ